jgi:hypothetical protein
MWSLSSFLLLFGPRVFFCVMLHVYDNLFYLQIPHVWRGRAIGCRVLVSGTELLCVDFSLFSRDRIPGHQFDNTSVLCSMLFTVPSTDRFYRKPYSMYSILLNGKNSRKLDKLKSEKTRAYALTPRLKMSFNNSISVTKCTNKIVLFWLKLKLNSFSWNPLKSLFVLFLSNLWALKQILKSDLILDHFSYSCMLIFSVIEYLYQDQFPHY